MNSSKACELCNNAASLYCEADNAFLCKSCDAKVHQANFLVARHIRHVITKSKAFYDFDLNLLPLSSANSSSNTSNISTEEESLSSFKNKRKPNRIHAEGILVNWCRAMGINGNVKPVLLSSANEALGLCLTNLTTLPFRVILTASFWFGLRCCSNSSGTGGRSLLTCQNLKRLECVSKVPCKLILSVEMKLFNKTVNVRKEEESPFDLAEGWAESA
ncbi:hypothetical protein ACFE04_031407 [Oxalis oulophora]